MEKKNLLQKELKQNIPFSSRSQEAVVGLMRTADMIRRKIAFITKPYDITPQQYNVLRILRGAGEEGLPILEIADRMIENSPGITRFIDSLENKQLIYRKKSDTDRRCQICKISEKGKELLSRLDGPMKEFDQTLYQRLDENEISQLITFLDKIRE